MYVKKIINFIQLLYLFEFIIINDKVDKLT